MNGGGFNMLDELKNRQKEKGIISKTSSSSSSSDSGAGSDNAGAKDDFSSSNTDSHSSPKIPSANTSGLASIAAAAAAAGSGSLKKSTISTPPKDVKPAATAPASNAQADLLEKLNRRRQMTEAGENPTANIESKINKPAISIPAVSSANSSSVAGAVSSPKVKPPVPSSLPNPMSSNLSASSSLKSQIQTQKRPAPSEITEESEKPSLSKSSHNSEMNQSSLSASSSSSSSIHEEKKKPPSKPIASKPAIPVESEPTAKRPAVSSKIPEEEIQPEPAKAKVKSLAKAKSERKSFFTSGTKIASVDEALAAAESYIKGTNKVSNNASANFTPRSAKVPPKLPEEDIVTVIPPRRKSPPLEHDPKLDWEILTTAEGEPYYSNKVTGETTWVKPRELYDADELATLEGDWFWVAHEELAWVPSKVKSKLSNGGLEVIIMAEGVDSDETKNVTAKEIGPKIPMPQTLHNLTNDLVQLDEVHEPGIIDLLRRRYRRDKIYTSVGDILIAVNPFKATTLFTPAIMQKYATVSRDAIDLPPHPYAIINASYQDLMEYKTDQSLLISGESGAGKTVTVKVCLEFISEIAGSGDNGIEQKILASNPILESFGNAKTVRNDNSSRFGKFMEVHFDTIGTRQIIGCNMVNYLLEKSRVVSPAKGERNFHIFFYLLTQFPDAEQKELLIHGRSPESFKYLSPEGKACPEPETHDDGDECSKMRKAFTEMGFTKEETFEIYKTTAAVLHLGNIEFEEEGSTGSKVTDKTFDSVKASASLLGIDPKKLAEVLVKHESMQRDGLLTRAFNPTVAADARNALARHIYGRLFQFLVNRLNVAMADSPLAKKMNSGSGETNYIGMLDIFGFEIFEVNSFEQLCINFANEKLQQMFNRHTFTLEEKTYESQGIDFDRIEFHDSQPLLTFLGMGPPGEKVMRDGVFQLLDEQTVIGSGTDEKLLQAVSSRHKDKKTLFSDMCKSRTAFKIYHYAGIVEYEVQGFISKNADKLYDNIVTLMQSGCSRPFISVVLFSENGVGSSFIEDSGASSSSSGGAKMSVDSPSTPNNSTSRPQHKTQASLFMAQLQKLEERTNSTFPRYIRCVKPNQFKRPRLFEAPSSLQQLRFAGVFEAVSIRKKGFPFRHTHRHFYEVFRSIVPKAVSWDEWKQARVQEEEGNKTSFKKLAQRVHEALHSGPVPEAKDCKFGKTMVLYRAAQHRALEIARLTAINAAAIKIEKVAKGRYVRRHMPELRASRAECLAAIQSRDTDKLDKAISTGSSNFFKIRQVYDAEAVREAIRQEKAMLPKLVKTLGLDMNNEDNFIALENLIREIARFNKRDPLAFSTVSEAQKLKDLYAVSVDKRDARDALLEAISFVPTSPAVETVEFLAAALGNAMDVARSSCGDGTYFAKEFKEATNNFEHLSTEIDLVRNSIAWSESSAILGDPKHKQPGDVDFQTQCESNLPGFRETVEGLQSYIPYSPDVKKSLILLEVLLRLREATLRALALGEGAPASEPQWKDVESILRELSGKSKSEAEKENDAISSPKAILFQCDSNEIAIISSDLALRAAVDDVVSKLHEAIAGVDDEQLSVALEQATVLQMRDHPDENIRNVVADGDDLLPRVVHARQLLAEAIEEVDENLLADALKAQTACGYGVSPGMAGHETVVNARQLFAWVLDLTAQARQATEYLYPLPTENILAGSKKIKLRIAELQPLQDFIDLPIERRLLREKEAAVATGNYRRAVRLAIEYRDIQFKKADATQNYSLQHFPKLKTPEEYAKRFGIKWSRYKDSMLHFYNPMFGKIHCSLTNIECQTEEDTKAMNKRALSLSKNIFGIMGDKNYENIDALVFEITSECLTHSMLRDEIYCQILKQLTKNPNPESENRGWNLLALCLSVFPPSQQFDMYLEAFLRQHSRKELVEKLHQTLLGGPLTSSPSLELLAQFRVPNNTTFWMPGKRTQITLDEQMWKGDERIDQTVINWEEARYVPGSESGERVVERRRSSLSGHSNSLPPPRKNPPPKHKHTEESEDF